MPLKSKTGLRQLLNLYKRKWQIIDNLKLALKRSVNCPAFPNLMNYGLTFGGVRQFCTPFSRKLRVSINKGVPYCRRTGRGEHFGFG